jgi:hypothetical protein
MNLGRLKEELKLYIRDAILQDFFVRWINDALLELAGDFPFPSLERVTPWTVSTNVNGYAFVMPETYHRDLHKCLNSNESPVHILKRKEDLVNKDPLHADTGDLVTHVMVEDTGGDKRIFTYPKANDLLYLWGKEKPPYLAEDVDEPTWFPAEYRARVIIAKVILKNYPILQDLVENAPHQSLQFWQAEYKKGLHGERGGDTGLINLIARARGTRRQGGRDPIYAGGNPYQG